MKKFCFFPPVILRFFFRSKTVETLNLKRPESRIDSTGVDIPVQYWSTFALCCKHQQYETSACIIIGMYVLHTDRKKIRYTELHPCKHALVDAVCVIDTRQTYIGVYVKQRYTHLSSFRLPSEATCMVYRCPTTRLSAFSHSVVEGRRRFR